VTYAGNSSSNTITVGDHFSLQTNLPGSQLFSSPGSDVFQAVQDLITGLQAGTNIDSAVNEISSAYQHINAQRVFYGNAVNQLDSQQSYLNSETTQLAQQQDTIGGADLTTVISNLESAQTSRQATLEAMAQTQQTNLFNYIK
jgi:flagellin-like hook-associated protein FlgL